jgi:hypothetical protein
MTTPDSMTALLRGIQRRLSALESRTKGPRACWGRIQVVGTAPVRVDYPAGLFAEPPTLLVTLEGTSAVPVVSSHTDTGFSVAQTGGGSHYLNWHALSTPSG